MDFESKYKICLYKSYFDTGLGLTSYFKYLLAFFALSSLDVKTTMIIGIVYGFFAYFIGWAWYQYDWVTASIEVGNRYNVFVNEVRKKIIKEKDLKT